jgi:hypothetical protein
MIYSVRGAAFAMVVVAVVGGYSAVDRSANFKPATATITTIDRNCDIIETSYDADYKRKSSRTYRDTCNSIDDWEKVKEKRDKDISGKAVVHVSYNAPQNGQSQMGELTFTGRDDEFYKLKAGDEIKILVSNSDPTKIRKA